MLPVLIIVTGLYLRVIFADHRYAAWQECNLILIHYVGPRCLTVTFLVDRLAVAHLDSGVVVLHQKVTFVEVVLIFTFDGLLFEMVVTLGHLNDVPIKATVQRSNLALGHSVSGASSLLLLDRVVSLCPGLLSTSTVARTAVSFGRIGLLNFHAAAHGRLRAFCWVRAQVFPLRVVEQNRTICAVESA